MVIRRARALFAVSLTLALVQLLAVAAASRTESRLQSAPTWGPAQQKSQAVSVGADAGHVDPDGHHITATPFAAPAAYAPGLSAGGLSPLFALALVGGFEGDYYRTERATIY